MHDTCIAAALTLVAVTGSQRAHAGMCYAMFSRLVMMVEQHVYRPERSSH